MPQPRNKFERAISAKLKALKVKAEYETLKLPYSLQCVYNPDWIIGDTIVEGKGYFDAPARRKMQAVRKQYPEKRIIICYYKPTAKIAGSKTTYAEWAEKNGFEWCTIDTLKDKLRGV